MEIERKWLVKGWPGKELPFIYEEKMKQGYLSVRPTVRIREEAKQGGETQWILCFKSEGGLARKEIELSVPKEKFEELEDLIGLPLILKTRRTYELPDGHHLEVNHVDEGQPTEFWYAEIEYDTVEEAMRWSAGEAAMEEYLQEEVTGTPGQSMGAYWLRTREKK